MKYLNRFLLLFSFASVAHESADIHYYYCRSDHVELALFLTPQIQNNSLSIEFDKQKFKLKNLIIKNQQQHLTVKADSKKTPQQFFFNIVKPTSTISSQQAFKTKVVLRDNSSCQFFDVDCELINVSNQIIEDITGFMP